MRVVGLGQIHFFEAGSIWAGVSLTVTGVHAQKTHRRARRQRGVTAAKMNRVKSRRSAHG